MTSQNKRQFIKYNSNYNYPGNYNSNFTVGNIVNSKSQNYNKIPNVLYKILKSYSEENKDSKSKEFKYPNYNKSFTYIIKNLKKQNVQSIEDLESILVNDNNDRDLDTICNNFNQTRILVRNEFKQLLKICIETSKLENNTEMNIQLEAKLK